MKLSLCATLLLCASYVTALNVVQKCGGPLKSSCPSNFEIEYHGKNMLNSECFCVRPETKEEEATRRHKERPERCQTALDQCRQYDSNHPNDMGYEGGCDEVMDYCERKDINLLCYDLKKRGAKWDCETAKSYKNRINGDEAKERKRVCESVRETCHGRGQYFSTTDKKSKSCEDLVRTCPKDEVIAFCKNHNFGKRGKWKCEKQPCLQGQKRSTH